MTDDHSQRSDKRHEEEDDKPRAKILTKRYIAVVFTPMRAPIGDTIMGSEVVFAARLVLGIVFLISSWGKLSLSRTQLLDAVMDYRLLSHRQARLVASTLPVVELILAILCIVGIGLPVVSSLVALLLLIFTAAIYINLARGRRFNCHCFGTSNALIGPASIVRNALLIAVAIFVAGQSFSLLGLQPTATQWRADGQMLIHLNVVVPLLASVLLSLIILFLVSETDVLFSGVVSKKKEG